MSKLVSRHSYSYNQSLPTSIHITESNKHGLSHPILKANRQKTREDCTILTQFEVGLQTDDPEQLQQPAAVGTQDLLDVDTGHDLQTHLDEDDKQVVQQEHVPPAKRWRKARLDPQILSLDWLRGCLMVFVNFPIPE